MDWPVIAEECSEQRKSAVRAISSAVWPRPWRMVSRKPASCSSLLTLIFWARLAPSSLDMAVSVTGPGQMAFTRTPLRAATAAVTRVRPSIPGFAAAYAEPQAKADLAERLEILRMTPLLRAYISGRTSLV